MVGFDKIFREFVVRRDGLKVVHVATADEGGKPNSAPKMLVDIEPPNKVFYLDYKFTRSYANLLKNRRISLSVMDEAAFRGFRLTGEGEILGPGEEFERVRKCWEKRLISYQVERIVQRVKGLFSARRAENALPKDFVIVQVLTHEGSIVQPDRVLRAIEKG